MAVTKTSLTWASDSSTTQTVPFEVIAAGDIDVYVEGVLQLQQNTTSTADATHPQVVSEEITEGTELTNYTVASNNGSITFNEDLTVGDFVVIERTTDDTLLETFTYGSTVRARDLNSAFERVLFIAQEGVNIANEALAPADDEDDTLDAKGERISNVADATDDDDAVNRAQLGKVITDDLVAGEGIDLTDASGGENSGQQVTVSAELSTATNPGVVQVNATTPITATYTNPGELDLSIEDGSIDIGKIQTDDIITRTEQDAGSPSPSDTSLFTSSAAAKRFDTLVQTGTPSGSDYETGKTWLQNDDDLTLSIWNGSTWTAVTSGGTFINQPKVIYVDSGAGDDNNDGHRISRPKLTIRAALSDINSDDDGDGTIISVAPGIYAETLPLDIEKNDIAIIGQSLRTCIIHPLIPEDDHDDYDVDTPHSQELQTMFRVNSGSYFQNLTLTGMKASGTRGASGSLYTDSTRGLPPNQGWNFAFFPGATIRKSPYVQNCTNFSDSQINNVTFTPHTPGEGAAGDLDSAPTGGGILVDGSVPAATSPLRSIVADSYTHTALNGPGILCTNNGYMQATSSYAFFNHAHITCINGGQANLAASTTDFGRYALIADGRSPNAIFTSTVDGTPADGDTTFNIDAPTAGTDLYGGNEAWFGDAERPATNMLVEVNSITYPILSATANGDGWTVEISRPDPDNRSDNLGLDGALTDGAAVSFFLRSMIASSGHTMEYVGSGTDYRALPENGGVPDETRQKTELNNGKIWTATTDHNGKFTVGGNQTDDPIFEVDQQLGFVTIPEGSIAFNLLSDETPQLGGNLDVNSNTITGLPDAPTADDEAASKKYVDDQISGIDEVVEDTTPQLGGNLDVNGNTITSTSNANVVIDPNGTGTVDVSTSRITSVTDPTDAQDAATKNYVDTERDTRLALSGGTMTGDITFNSGQTFPDVLASSGGALTGDLTLNAQSDLRFADSDSSNWVAFQAPETVSANVTWTLPDADATVNGHALKSDGSGNLSWGTAGGASGGGTDQVFYENDQSVTEDYTIGTNKNAMSAGPITIDSGATVTIPDGSTWVIV